MGGMKNGSFQGMEPWWQIVLMLVMLFGSIFGAGYFTHVRLHKCADHSTKEISSSTNNNGSASGEQAAREER